MCRKIDPNWVLLYNQSTVNVFSHGSLLRNIPCANRGLDIYCTSGEATTHMVGDLPGFGTVWYHPKGIVNIVLLAAVEFCFPVTYDSGNNRCFIIHKSNGKADVLKNWREDCFILS
eukprot:6097225-Ditylum_brightwellii.AAC.1